MTGRNVTLVIADYLARIGLAEAPAPARTTSGLVRSVAVAQHRTVPFENLDVHRGEIVDVEPGAIVERLIQRHRGGICYQLNGLLSLALEMLEVPVALWGARVDAGGGPGPALGHMAVVFVDECGDRCLVDVGFGGEAVWQRVDPHDPETLRVRTGGAEYVLDPTDRTLGEFAGMARWHSTSPQSRFTGSLICTLPHDPARPHDSGRQTLAGRFGTLGGPIDYRLIEGDGGGRTEAPVGFDEVASLLEDRFGMPGVTVPRASLVAGHS